MQINKDNFRSARFCDNDRRQIEIILADRENVNEYIPYVIELDQNHPDFQQLMNVTTLPEIHDYTDKWCTEQRHRFKKEMLDIAVKEGIIPSKDKWTKKTVNKDGQEVKEIVKEVVVQEKLSFSDIITKIYGEEIDMEKEENKEQMFKAKLTAFEMPFIKDSENRGLKAQLRKAQSFKEVISVINQF